MPRLTRFGGGPLDFPIAAPGEVRDYTIDFAQYVPAGGSISSVIWSLAVSAVNGILDPDPNGHLVSTASLSGTKSTQRIASLLSGNYYLVTVTALLSDGELIELWTYLPCQQPFSLSTSYAAQGVNFNKSLLTCSSLSSVDNSSWSFSCWYRTTQSNNQSVYWVCNPLGGSNAFFEFNGADDTNVRVRASYTGASPGSVAVVLANSIDVWHHIFATVTTVLLVWLDGVLSQSLPFSGTLRGFNSVPLLVGGNGTLSLLGDLADLRIMPGLSLGAADLLNFRTADGKPVAPSVATNIYGEPAVLLSASPGDAASFSTNQGTGGAFTTTGTLTLSSTNPP